MHVYKICSVKPRRLYLIEGEVEESLRVFISSNNSNELIRYQTHQLDAQHARIHHKLAYVVREREQNETSYAKQGGPDASKITFDGGATFSSQAVVMWPSTALRRP